MFWHIPDMPHVPVRHLGFVLIPGFPLMAYASAIEPIRAANLIAGREVYRLTHYAPGGGAVLSSSGAMIECQPLPTAGDGLDMAFVCAGGGPEDWDFPALKPVLRRLARAGVRLGGISGGPYLLAEAGLLDGYDFTIHWEHLGAFAEVFPALAPRQARFVVDRGRITCGGGVAPLDMMHALISEDHGPAFARRVSDWFLHTDIAAPADPQRSDLTERYGVTHPALVTVLEAMEAHIERPLGRDAMAAQAGISARHLDRLFSEKMSAGFLEVYRRIRLAAARRLLQQSPMPISEIAYATGFSSASHLTRAYREAFGQTPAMARRG